MAKKNKKKQPNQYTKKRVNQQPTKRNPKEPSPKEILFFKIGMSLIGLAVIVIAIIFIVQYYMEKAEEDPYQDYVVITVDELLLLTKYDDSGSYGDPDTLKQDEYETINTLFQSNAYFYVYFYHSSNPDDEIVATIEDYTGVDQIPTMTLLEDEPDESYKAFYFFDLDDAVNASLFENTAFDHLALDTEAENILLTFSHNDNAFTSTIDINKILSTIIDLQS